MSSVEGLWSLVKRYLAKQQQQNQPQHASEGRKKAKPRPARVRATAETVEARVMLSTARPVGGDGQIIFVDATVAKETHLEAGANVVLIDPSRDALTQISQTLKGR